MHAMFNGNGFHQDSVRLLELLVQEGADVFARSHQGNPIDGTPFDYAQRRPLTENAKEIKRDVTAWFLQYFCNHVAQREGDNLLHAILTEATFTKEPDGRPCVELLLGTLSTAHMYSLLQLVLRKRPFAICAVNQNGHTPLAAACLMDLPVYIIEFLLYAHPNGLSDIVLQQ